MPQSSQTVEWETARAALYAALMAGGPHSPQRSAKASAAIETFRAEVLSLAGKSLGDLGFPNASALLADTAAVVLAAARNPEAEPQTLAHGLTAKEAAFRLIADTTNNPETAAQFRQAADQERADTFPAWLARRMDPQGPDWDEMGEEDRSHWEHEARAVRRAVARGGFKAEAGAR